MDVGKRAIAAMAMLWTVVLVASVAAAITLAAMKNATPQASAPDDLKQRYERLEQVRTLLMNEYYVPLDEDVLLAGAVEGMLAAVGDPYTYYYTPEEMREALSMSEGVYAGIGIQVLYTPEGGSVTVTRCYDGAPAQLAGMRPGDVIVRVNDCSAYSDGTEAMLGQLHGEPGESVRITVQRDGALKTFGLAYTEIHVTQVKYGMLDADTGYAIIYEFSGDCVEGVKNALQFFEDNGARSMVLDLRHNPGGLLSDVTQIADMLLPEGLIVYTQDRHGNRVDYDSDAECAGLPLAVLVDSMSASAAEILAGAVQDMGVGALVGERTYGKGIVQSVVPFSGDGAGMQLTTASYYTPRGRSIHGVGLTPDISVELTDIMQSAALGGALETDAQLTAARAYLAEEIAAHAA